MAMIYFEYYFFFEDEKTVVLTNTFQKKPMKIPKNEINLTIRRKKEYFIGKIKMGDLKKYIDKRKKEDPAFTNNYEL